MVYKVSNFRLFSVWFYKGGETFADFYFWFYIKGETPTGFQIENLTNNKHFELHRKWKNIRALVYNTVICDITF